jgi:hypothetical protein
MSLPTVGSKGETLQWCSLPSTPANLMSVIWVIEAMIQVLVAILFVVMMSCGQFWEEFNWNEVWTGWFQNDSEVALDIGDARKQLMKTGKVVSSSTNALSKEKTQPESTKALDTIKNGSLGADTALKTNPSVPIFQGMLTTSIMDIDITDSHFHLNRGKSVRRRHSTVGGPVPMETPITSSPVPSKPHEEVIYSHVLPSNISYALNNNNTGNTSLVKPSGIIPTTPSNNGQSPTSLNSSNMLQNSSNSQFTPKSGGLESQSRRATNASGILIMPAGMSQKAATVGSTSSINSTSSVLRQNANHLSGQNIAAGNSPSPLPQRQSLANGGGSTGGLDGYGASSLSKSMTNLPINGLGGASSPASNRRSLMDMRNIGVETQHQNGESAGSPIAAHQQAVSGSGSGNIGKKPNAGTKVPVKSLSKALSSTEISTDRSNQSSQGHTMEDNDDSFQVPLYSHALPTVKSLKDKTTPTSTNSPQQSGTLLSTSVASPSRQVGALIESPSSIQSPAHTHAKKRAATATGAERGFSRSRNPSIQVLSVQDFPPNEERRISLNAEDAEELKRERQLAVATMKIDDKGAGALAVAAANIAHRRVSRACIHNTPTPKVNTPGAGSTTSSNAATPNSVAGAGLGVPGPTGLSAAGAQLSRSTSFAQNAQSSPEGSGHVVNFGTDLVVGTQMPDAQNTFSAQDYMPISLEFDDGRGDLENPAWVICIIAINTLCWLPWFLAKLGTSPLNESKALAIAAIVLAAIRQILCSLIVVMRHDGIRRAMGLPVLQKDEDFSKDNEKDMGNKVESHWD